MIDRRNFLKGSAAALAIGAAYKGLSQTVPSPRNSVVTYDERSVLVGGRRLLIASGEIHYPRSTRAMWPVLLKRSKALGLNTIASYVFWNVHEPRRGVYDFSGERDLGHFLDLCQQQGFSVFLRVGPYICAEWNYGGFPPYLREEPGITIRTMNKPYTDRVEAYFERLAEVVKPRLASNGGPVILVQVENEYTNVAKRYGAEGQEYLRWIVELAKRVGFASVPSTMCEGGAQGAIETSNGFAISPERIAAVRNSHPGTPLLWTENWPAWYRVWGGRAVPAADGRFMAGGILDFISRGGSGFSYYPWHGGTNFARNPMYLQITSYDFSAPLDEYGNATATGIYLGRLHAMLHEHGEILLEGERTEALEGSSRMITWRKGNDEIRMVQQIPPEPPPGQGFFPLQVKGARLTNSSGEVLFDVDATRQTVTQSFVESAWKPLAQMNDRPLQWQAWDEPFPAERDDIGVVSVDPIEQLSLTHDSTDYCWYSSNVQVTQDGPRKFVIPYGGDFFYLYVDGQLRATSKLPLSENRGAITPDDPAHPRIIANTDEPGHEHGFEHAFALETLTPGPHRIDLLATAVGMVKGDWQIASPMNFERKGIWEGVLWNDKPLLNWTMRPGLTGERNQLPAQTGRVSWRTFADSRPLRWFKTQADVPGNLLGGTAVFRLDATGLGKGMIWVNGNAIGRHWLIQARAPFRPSSTGAAVDTLSQRYYHIPADWLRLSNEIVILEEQAASPAAVQLQARL